MASFGHAACPRARFSDSRRSMLPTGVDSLTGAAAAATRALRPRATLPRKPGSLGMPRRQDITGGDLAAEAAARLRHHPISSQRLDAGCPDPNTFQRFVGGAL